MPASTSISMARSPCRARLPDRVARATRTWSASRANCSSSRTSSRCCVRRAAAEERDARPQVARYCRYCCLRRRARASGADPRRPLKRASKRARGRRQRVARVRGSPAAQRRKRQRRERQPRRRGARALRGTRRMRAASSRETAREPPLRVRVRAARAPVRQSVAALEINGKFAYP